MSTSDDDRRQFFEDLRKVRRCNTANSRGAAVYLAHFGCDCAFRRRRRLLRQQLQKQPGGTTARLALISRLPSFSMSPQELRCVPQDSLLGPTPTQLGPFAGQSIDPHPGHLKEVSWRVCLWVLSRIGSLRSSRRLQSGREADLASTAACDPERTSAIFISRKRDPYSITRSAIRSTCSGTVNPNALAVRRLITNSNLVGCSTGRSAGFAPFRMRST